jgi:hypothetical protein
MTRRRCCPSSLRNLIAKLPKSERDRIRFKYWSALTDATSVKDGKLLLQGIGRFRMMDGSRWVLPASEIASRRVDLAVGMIGRLPAAWESLVVRRRRLRPGVSWR